jgi:hypothetical protein
MRRFTGVSGARSCASSTSARRPSRRFASHHVKRPGVTDGRGAIPDLALPGTCPARAAWRQRMATRRCGSQAWTSHSPAIRQHASPVPLTYSPRVARAAGHRAGIGFPRSPRTGSETWRIRSCGVGARQTCDMRPTRVGDRGSVRSRAHVGKRWQCSSMFMSRPHVPP